MSDSKLQEAITFYNGLLFDIVEFRMRILELARLLNAQFVCTKCGAILSQPPAISSCFRCVFIVQMKE